MLPNSAAGRRYRRDVGHGGAHRERGGGERPAAGMPIANWLPALRRIGRHRHLHEIGVDINNLGVVGAADPGLSDVAQTGARDIDHSADTAIRRRKAGDHWRALIGDSKEL